MIDTIFTVKDLKIFLSIKLGKKYRFQIRDNDEPYIVDVVFYPVKWFSFIKKHRIRKVLKELREKHIQETVLIREWFWPSQFQ